MSDVQLEVNGLRYEGWESVTISRSIESISDSFSLVVGESGSDWPIVEEDECTVLIDGTQVLNGYVERTVPSFSENDSVLSVSGYSKTAVLAACSSVLDRWSFKNSTVLDVAIKVCQPFGITVSVQPGLVIPSAPRKLVVNPGETGFDVINAAAKASGVLVVSDGVGGILITRSGTARTNDALVQGQNMIGGSGEYDASIRYSKYVVMSQISGTDNAHGSATKIRAEAFDDGVRRTNRILLIQPEAGHSMAFARRLGDWEARNRAAQSKAVQVVTSGWKQSNGDLWPVNSIVHVKSPKLRIDAEMLIAQVEFSKGTAGEITTMRVVRPDAFEPSPAARVIG